MLSRDKKIVWISADFSSIEVFWKVRDMHILMNHAFSKNRIGENVLGQCMNFMTQVMFVISRDWIWQNKVSIHIQFTILTCYQNSQ